MQSNAVNRRSGLDLDLQGEIWRGGGPVSPDHPGAFGEGLAMITQQGVIQPGADSRPHGTETVEELQAICRFGWMSRSHTHDS